MSQNFSKEKVFVTGFELEHENAFNSSSLGNLKVNQPNLTVLTWPSWVDLIVKRFERFDL